MATFSDIAMPRALAGGRAARLFGLFGVRPTEVSVFLNLSQAAVLRGYRSADVMHLDKTLDLSVLGTAREALDLTEACWQSTRNPHLAPERSVRIGDVIELRRNGVSRFFAVVLEGHDPVAAPRWVATPDPLEMLELSDGRFIWVGPEDHEVDPPRHGELLGQGYLTGCMQALLRERGGPLTEDDLALEIREGYCDDCEGPRVPCAEYGPPDIGAVIGFCAECHPRPFAAAAVRSSQVRALPLGKQ